MSSIDPSSSSGSPPADPVPSSDPAPPPDPSSSSADTISGSSNGSPYGAIMFASSSSATPWLDPPQALSLLQYANLVGVARINLRSQTAFTNELGFTVNKQMWQNSAAAAAQIREFYYNVRVIQQKETQIANEEQALANQINPAIDAYNAANDFTGDTQAVNTLNQAITDYNNGTITQAQYNLAVTNYNAYADAHNMQPYVTTYNQAADDYNTQAADINTEINDTNLLRAQTNLPPLPLEPTLPSGTLPLATSSPPATPPGIPLLPLPPTGPIPNNVPQVYAESLDTLLEESNFKKYAKDLLNAVNVVDDALGSAGRYRDDNKFVHGNLLEARQSLIDTEAFKQKNDRGSTPSTDGQAAASSSGYTSLALGLNPIGLPRVLGLNLYKAATKATQLPLQLADYLALTNLSIGHTAGLLSASPGVLSIGDDSLDANAAGGPPVKVLVALGYANVIRGLINNQQLSGIVGNLLSTNGVSDADLARLTRVLTAGFQLSLTQQAIFQVASALGLPGFITQVLGNIAGIPNLSSVVSSASQPTVNDLIHSNAVVANLKSNIQGNDVVNQAIERAATQGDYATSQAFGDAIQQQLINEGVVEDDAIAAGYQAKTFIDTAVAQQTLNQSVIDEQVKANSIQNSNLAASQLAGESRTLSEEQASLLTGNTLARRFSAELLDQATLQHSLQDALARIGGNPSVAASIASGILEQNFSSSAEVRNFIAGQLIRSGLSASQAHQAAFNVSLGADPFQTAGGSTVLPLSTIADRIQQEAYAALRESFGSPTALSVARQLAQAIVGSPDNADIVYSDHNRPVSLFNQINDQISVLKETNDRELLTAVNESFREFMRPNDNLFYIAYLQNTPGRELVNAMSLMNAGHGDHPSNFLKSIDIPA